MLKATNRMEVPRVSKEEQSNTKVEVKRCSSTYLNINRRPQLSKANEYMLPLKSRPSDDGNHNEAK